MILVYFQGQSFNITVIQVYTPTTSSEETSWMVLWKSRRSSKTNTHPRDVLFIIGDWNARVEYQEILGVTGKFDPGVQNKAEQMLIEFCQKQKQTSKQTNNEKKKHWS